ncbi:hypothetical protein [Streptomyces cacaoi]|uniref:Uncharacterized protein n=1 Tax=Streptomyces cacaoi TaxID=1898 RepID=A0A4Y3QYC9_STRCI|nr:hypothetical protein [Streptomyces cacaoi]GEB50425.1 hypothetical protein SCA03_29760 [Streptomyces cacaoi]
MRIRVVNSHDYMTEGETHITREDVYGALRTAPGTHKELFISLGPGTSVERVDSTKGRRIYGSAWVGIIQYPDGGIATVARQGIPHRLGREVVEQGEAENQYH